MVEHICGQCKKSFDRKDAYTKHITRQKPCVGPIYKDVLKDNMTTITELIKAQTEATKKMQAEITALTEIIKQLVLSKT